MMWSLFRPTKTVRLLPSIRKYTASTALFQPTTSTSTDAFDVKDRTASMEAQKKRSNLKEDRHWVEASATASEADVSKRISRANEDFYMKDPAVTDALALGQS